MSSDVGIKSSATGVVRSEAGALSYDQRVLAHGSPETSVTPRQLEVLALVASGYSYSDVAKMKFYSPHTVQNHVTRAVVRSGARSAVHLCVMLVEAGMIRRNANGVYEPVQDLRVVE